MKWVIERRDDGRWKITDPRCPNRADGCLCRTKPTWEDAVAYVQRVTRDEGAKA